MLKPMIENLATVLSVLAAVIALLSAMYARRQVEAASRANEIALHKDRLHVYSGLLKFTTHISSYGVDITRNETWKFLEVVNFGEFYFPKVIADRLNAIFNNSLKLLELNEQWETAKKEYGHEEAKRLVEPRHELMKVIRTECLAITEEFRSYLRLGGTRVIQSYR